MGELGVRVATSWRCGMQANEVQWERGFYYHLYNSGANRTSIFYEDTDYLDFLRRLKKYITLHQVYVKFVADWPLRKQVPRGLLEHLDKLEHEE